MNKGKPKGSNQGKALSPTDQEAIRQLYLVYNNKREVARRMGVCEKTVHNVLNDVSSQEFDKARAEAALETAGRVQGVVHQAIDSVTPEKLDNAPLSQLGIFIGIGIDKIERLQQHARNLREQRSEMSLLMPQQIQALKDGIRGKINAMAILGFRIEEQNPDLAERLDEAMQVAEMITEEPEKPAPEKLDFYNAPRTGDDGLPNDDEPVDRNDAGEAE